MDLPAVPGTRLSAARVLLGLFVLLQLAFMVAANGQKLLADLWNESNTEHAGAAAQKSVAEIVAAYEQLTGQEQGGRGRVRRGRRAAGS